MTFTFVHTADWQIGKPFSGFDPETASSLREARLACVDDIADVAERAGARHVLVAGDVFDSETAPAKLVAQLLGTLAAHPRLTWHLLPGNHDPVRPGSVWGEITRIGCPATVRVLLAPEPVEMAPGVVLLPAPLTQKSTTLDPTQWMDAAVTPAGVLRIGLAHGSVQGNFGGGDGDAAVPIAPDRPERARLDYLALGDWHGTVRIGDRVWYSGTHETDKFPDNEPGHVLIVRLERAGAKPAVERIATSRYRWEKRQLRVAGLEDVTRFVEEIQVLGRNQKTVLLELTVTGAVGLAVHAEVMTALAGIMTLRHFDANTDGLLALAGSDDLIMLGEGAVRVAAERLKALADGGGAEAATARRALAQLALFAAADARAP